MNRFVAAGAGTYLLGFACTAQDARFDVVISDVTVISPERAAPLEHAYVRILDGRIAELTERPLEGEEEISGTDRYLVPGLIDSHVHLAVSPGFPSGMTAEQAAAHPGIVAAALAQDPKSYLYFGFTTVVDLIGTAERTARWNALESRPDAHFCGGAQISGDNIQLVPAPFFSYGEEGRIEPIELAPEAAVARIAADGAICIKTFYLDGPPGTPTPSLETAQALVAAGHEQGLPVFIHANRKSAQAFAVAAGVDVIVHGMATNPGEGAVLDDEAHEILAAIVRDDIGYQSTIQAVYGVLELFNDGYLARPELANAYPAALLEWYAREEAGWYAEALRGFGVDVESWMRASLTRVSRVTGILAETNGHLLFGSDTPSDTTYANPPGLNGRLEMDNWITAGVPHGTLFRALTIDNAQMLGLDNELGTVEVGKVANLLLLQSNPLEHLEAYDTIAIVFLHGQPILRERLSARNAPED